MRAGIARARAQGKPLGRQPYQIADDRFEAVADQSLRDAAVALGVSRSVVHRWRLSRKPLETGPEIVTNCSGISRWRRDRACHADNWLWDTRPRGSPPVRRHDRSSPR